ncbi:hypothetical protein Amet_2484 [Alkaliphilus metalliredigens QYMF]|uniref:Prepilin-type N-terminal cleavage/methylation domain-containing protein n=1 Tax=Alkaliphilus metalliredigens (strain QYMF) TaxID=293826 RepID=A6TR19_ALKMQ|nr:prepilin-type N-terminal cleavage/methylation domain-containing protein [Alkaliphilus metalliredigens]ABR48637.1 hypothetical protein Amet_2484 [Alkaliphilus metalliredigens QYMF]
MKNNGFTFVEVLIALMILTIAIAPGMRMFTHAMKVSELSQHTYRSHKQMQEVMETIKALKSVENELTLQLDEAVKIQLKNVDAIYDFYQVDLYIEGKDNQYLSSYLLGETAYSLLNKRYQELPVTLN